MKNDMGTRIINLGTNNVMTISEATKIVKTLPKSKSRLILSHVKGIKEKGPELETNFDYATMRWGLTGEVLMAVNVLTNNAWQEFRKRELIRVNGSEVERVFNDRDD